MLDLKSVLKDKNSDKILEELTLLCNTIKEQNEKFEEFKKEIAKFRSEVEEIKTMQKTSLKEFSSNLNQIIESKQKLQQELVDFKVLKGHFQDKIIDTLSGQINENAEKLKTDIKNYNELKNEISGIVDELKGVKSELAKFKELGERISKMDFALVNYAKTLERENQEKLRLMSEIDYLKRLIAKERRREQVIRH